jgi:hypothetical protein
MPDLTVSDYVTIGATLFSSLVAIYIAIWGRENLRRTKPIKPGTPAPVSGQYRSVPRSTNISAVMGWVLPPTPPDSSGWTMTDPPKGKK